MRFLYRALDHLVRGKEDIEPAVFARNRALFSPDVDLVLKDLRQRFSIRRVVIVADRGVVSEAVMEELEKERLSYILRMRPRKNKEVGKEVLSRAGRCHRVADNLEVK